MKRKRKSARAYRNHKALPTLCISLLICVSLTLICSVVLGKWMISQPEGNAPNYVDPKPTAPCGCFFMDMTDGVRHVETDAETGTVTAVYYQYTYNGQTHAPTLSAEEREIYGDIVGIDGATEGFKIEWQGVVFDGGVSLTDSKGKKVTGIDRSAIEDDDEYGLKNGLPGGSTLTFSLGLESIVGTHTYKITDTLTGQTICNNHKIKIVKATPTIAEVSAPEDKLYFVNDKLSWKDELRGAGDTVIACREYSYTIAEGDYPSRVDTAIYAREATRTLNSLKHTVIGGDLWNYNYAIPSSVEVSYTVLPTVYSYSSGVATFYGTLNSALEATNATTSATSIVAMQSFDYDGDIYKASGNAAGDYTHVISGTRSIGGNVSLIVPYKGSGSSFTASEGMTTTDRYAKSPTETYPTNEAGEASSASAHSFTPAAICVNEIILNGALTNNGRIEICGITGHPNNTTSIAPQAITTGNHATLTINNGASLTIPEGATGANIEVHGYIVGEGDVIAKSGTVTMPFCVYDYNGARVLLGMYAGKADGQSLLSFIGGYEFTSDNTNVSPFTIFDMPNIQTTLICYGGSGGATINAITSLFTPTTDLKVTTMPAQYNLADFKIFSNSNALINMTDGYATFEYNESDDSAYTKSYKDGYKYKKDGSYIPATNAQTKITLSGNTYSGDLSMLITVAKGIPLLGDISANVSLSTVRFPVSSKLALYLDGGGASKSYEYNFTQDFKFMPGSHLYIKNYAQVTVEKDILIYKATDSGGKYINTWTDSQGGTITLYASYYSKFYDYKNDAVCEIGSHSTLKVTGGFGGYVKATSSDATLDLSTATALSVTEAEGDGGGSGIDIFFYAGPTISLGVSGYTATNSSYTLADQLQKRVYTASGVTTSDGAYAWKANTINLTLDATGGTVSHNNPVTVPASGYPVTSITPPIRDYYTFDHWCTKTVCDGNCPEVLFEDTTLYAIWKINTYMVTFKYIDPNGNVQESGINQITATAVDYTDLVLPSDIPALSTYSFGGWYDAASGGTRVTGLTIALCDKLADENYNLTIYGYWVAKRFDFAYELGDTAASVGASDYLPYGDITVIGTNEGIGYDPLKDPDVHSKVTSHDGVSESDAYYFDGWYIDEARTQAYTPGYDPGEGITSIVLYAKWTKKTTLTIDYGDIASGAEFTATSNLWFKPGATIDIANYLADDITKYDKIITVSKYFGSWKVTAGNATISGTVVSSGENASGTVTVTAQWIDKISITISPTNNGSSLTYSISAEGDTQSYSNNSDPLYFMEGQSITVTATGKCPNAFNKKWTTSISYGESSKSASYNSSLLSEKSVTVTLTFDASEDITIIVIQNVKS